MGAGHGPMGAGHGPPINWAKSPDSHYRAAKHDLNPNIFSMVPPMVFTAVVWVMFRARAMVRVKWNGGLSE